MKAEKNKKILIVGVDGLFGSNLFKILQEKGFQVYGTSRKKKDSKFIYLDLNDINNLKIPQNIDIAFIFAAVTSLNECRNNPEISRRINVNAIFKLAKYLTKRNIKIILPSTNLVFSGNKAYNKIDDPTNPKTEYGKQKSKLESLILNLSPNHSVIRFTKVVDKNNALINNWIKELKDHKIIYPFSDYIFSPVTIDFALKCLFKISFCNVGGLWHVSGTKDISYFEAIEFIASKLHLNIENIKPIKLKIKPQLFEYIPKHTVLECSKIKNNIGYKMPNVFETLKVFLEIKSFK